MAGKLAWLWDKWVTILLLYCDIGAGLRQIVLQYTRSIVDEEAKAGEVVSQYT